MSANRRKSIKTMTEAEAIERLTELNRLIIEQKKRIREIDLEILRTYPVQGHG